VLVGVVLGYGFYLREKDVNYMKVEQGICPKCKTESVELVDMRGSGCSPKILTFRCSRCGYEDIFTQKNSGCSI
jgi:predicted nucleic-acid-binding Zn-ribbon protein